MRRLVDLVTRIGALNLARGSLRATLAATARCVADAHPGTEVSIVRADARRGGVHRLARAGRATGTTLSDEILAPLARQVAANPARVRCWRSGAADPPLSAVVGAVPVRRLHAYCIAILGPVGSDDEMSFRAASVELARQMLASGIELTHAGHAHIQALIGRAKRDWESTADALPEIVGLLDGDLRLVRVSRAAERWGLGSVRHAAGQSLHGLLHPACAVPDCDLYRLIQDTVQRSPGEDRLLFEHADPVLGRDLVLTFVAAGEASAAGARRLAFSVADVSAERSAQRALLELNSSLERRVQERTAALEDVNSRLRAEVGRRQQAEVALRKSNVELALLSDALRHAQEKERHRIAQDLHDSVGQSLSAIKYSLERVQLMQDRRGEAAGAEILIDAVARSQRLISEVRSIAMNLRPAHLDGLGPVAAVRSLCREWASVYTHVAVKLNIAVDDSQIPAPLATPIFRTVQETLNNVARHADARHVYVDMRLTEATLAVTVRDDGGGFVTHPRNPERLGDRLGLRGLHERAEHSGGRCSVHSAVGQGTTVRLEWPLAAAQAAVLPSSTLN